MTGGSGGQTPTRVQVVGVDQGRRGDAGDMHSLRPIDAISECMLREYVCLFVGCCFLLWGVLWWECTHSFFLKF